MEFIEYTSADVLFHAMANQIAGELDGAIQQNTRATLCVPGGSTPGPLFDILNQTAIEWSAVDVMLSDERWVPETSDRSNSALVKNRLLQNAAVSARFVPFYCDGFDAQVGAQRIGADLDTHLPISTLVLGMGTDMHTASLFPKSAELAQGLSPDAPNLIAVDPGNDLEMRVTLTAQVLKKAENIHLLILGGDKRAALENAVGLDAAQAPVRSILDRATVHWAEH